MTNKDKGSFYIMASFFFLGMAIPLVAFIFAVGYFFYGTYLLDKKEAASEDTAE